MKNPGIAVGGATRLAKAIEAEVQKEFQHELAAANSREAKKAVERKIKKTIKERCREFASPYILWGGQ